VHASQYRVTISAVLMDGFTEAVRAYNAGVMRAALPVHAFDAHTRARARQLRQTPHPQLALISKAQVEVTPSSEN
jgi:hypothetical protein